MAHQMLQQPSNRLAISILCLSLCLSYCHLTTAIRSIILTMPNADLTSHAPKAHSPNSLRQRSQRRKRQDIHNYLHRFTPNKKRTDQRTPNLRSLQRNDRITKLHQDQQLLHNWRDLQECKQGLKVWKTPYPQRPQQSRAHHQNNQPTTQTQQEKVSNPNPLETCRYQHSHQAMQITGFSSKKHKVGHSSTRKNIVVNGPAATPKHRHNRWANKSRRTATKASCKNTKMQTKQQTTHYDRSNQREQTTKPTPPQQKRLLMKEASMKFPCADPAPTKSTQQKVSKLTYRQGKKEDHQLPYPPPTIDSKPGKTTTKFNLRTLGTNNTSPPTTTPNSNPILKPRHSSIAPKVDNTNPAPTTRNIKTTSNTGNIDPAPKKGSNKSTTREADSTQATPKHKKHIPTSSKAEPSKNWRLQKGSAIDATDAGCNTRTTEGRNKGDMSPKNTKGKQGMAVITAKSSNISIKKERQRSAGCHHRKPNRGSTISLQPPQMSKPRDRIHRPKTAPTGQHKRELHTLSLKHNSLLPHLFSTPLSYLLRSDLSSSLNSCLECYSLYSPSSRRVVYALIEKPLRADKFLPQSRSCYLSIRVPQIAREGLSHRTVASSEHNKKTKSSPRPSQKVREGPVGHTETHLEYRHNKESGQRGAGEGTGYHTEATPERSEAAGQQGAREDPGDHTEGTPVRSKAAGQSGAREGPGVYTETHPARRHEEARLFETRGAASSLNGRPQRLLEKLATPQPGFYKLQFSIRNLTHCTKAYYVSWVQCKTLQTFEGLCPTIVCVMYASAHLDKPLDIPRLVSKHTNSSITKQTHKHRYTIKVRRKTSHNPIRNRHPSIHATCTLVTMNLTLEINCYKTPFPKVILHPALQIKLWGGADFGILRVNHTSQNSKLSPSTNKWMLKQNFTSAKEIYREMPQNCLLSYKINRVKTNSLYSIQRNLLLISNKTKETLSCIQTISKSIHYTPPIKNLKSEVHRINTQKHLLSLINVKIKPNSLDLVIKRIFSKAMIELQSRQSISTESSTVQSISIKSICMQSFSKTINSPEIVHRVNSQKCVPSLLNKKIKKPDRVLKLIFPTKNKVIDLKCIQPISMKSSIV